MVKSVTVPGKCFAICDGDRPGNPKINITGVMYQKSAVCKCDILKVKIYKV